MNFLNCACNEGKLHEDVSRSAYLDWLLSEAWEPANARGSECETRFSLKMSELKRTSREASISQTGSQHDQAVDSQIQPYLTCPGGLFSPPNMKVLFPTWKKSQQVFQDRNRLHPALAASLS